MLLASLFTMSEDGEARQARVGEAVTSRPSLPGPRRGFLSQCQAPPPRPGTAHPPDLPPRGPLPRTPPPQAGGNCGHSAPHRKPQLTLIPHSHQARAPCDLTPPHSAAHARAGRQGTGLRSPSGLTGWSSRPSSLSSPRARVTLCSYQDKSPSDVGGRRQPPPRPRSPHARPAHHPCVRHASRGRL